MSREGLKGFFSRAARKYRPYLDYIDLPSWENIRGSFFAAAKAILAYFRGGNGKKRRVPFFALWLLLILFALNIGISVHNGMVSASPSAAKTSTQNTANTQTQNTDAVAMSSYRVTGQKQLDDGPTICPKIPTGAKVSYADIVEYAVQVSDDPNDVQNYAISQSSSPATLTINSNGTQIVINNASGTTTAQDQAVQQAIEQTCEQAFSGGVNNVKDGAEIYEATWTELHSSKEGNLSLCTNQGDKLLVDLNFAAVGNQPNVQDYCLYSKGNDNWIFPCSDLGSTPNYTAVKGDWLSGDIDATNTNSGHFEQTTVTEPVLFPAMQGVGLAILLPSIVLIGLQLAATGSGSRMAGAMEAASRVIMGAVLIFVCYGAIQILLGMSNTLAQAIVTFHGSYPYPQPTYYYALPPGQTADAKTVQIDFGYTLGTESTNDPTSYRGIVEPISRWGCTANAFMKILGSKLATDMAGYIPIIGNFIKAAGAIADAVELVKNAGEFIKTIMSVMLAVQLLVRLVLLNFYIMMAPIAFACWALPGGVGQNVVRGWFKGFLSILAIQVVQIFVISVAPLLIPTTLPTFPTDSTNVLNSFIHELPSIAILWAVLRVPKMLGTSATSMVSSAGQIAGGAIVAVGAAAYNVV